GHIRTKAFWGACCTPVWRGGILMNCDRLSTLQSGAKGWMEICTYTSSIWQKWQIGQRYFRRFDYLTI
ncbi:MAG: hypothetical protein IJV24_06785, partial [Prevotella sp.]|nr:hypothetical protein [Prevotella sp.]